MKGVASFVAGVLFAAGLCIAGMTSPASVIGFLDVRAWDSRLLFTLLAAVSVSMLAWRVRSRMSAPLAGGAFPGPASGTIDGRLLGGAALFGVGWGLGGFCPGPALVSLGAGVGSALVVFPAMLGGMLLFRLLHQRPAWSRRAGAGTVKSC